MWVKQLFEALPTDLASERHRQDPQDPKVAFASVRQGVVEIEEVTVKQEADEARYFTLTFPPSFDLPPEEYVAAVKTIHTHLEIMLPQKKDAPILVVGLGNPHMTVDALGAETLRMISATAHLRRDGICLLSPGVTATSGIQTTRMVSATVNAVCPRAVIAIDALCARSPTRLGNTIQISNVGITPGSGLGRSCASLTSQEIGVPVIAVGVPTLVSTAALLLEAMKEAELPEPPPRLRELLKEQSLYVCPKILTAPFYVPPHFWEML